MNKFYIFRFRKKTSIGESEKWGEGVNLVNLEEYESWIVYFIDANVRIKHVWSSNAIKGSTLNLYKTALILNTGIIVHRVSLRDTMAAVNFKWSLWLYDGSS